MRQGCSSYVRTCLWLVFRQEKTERMALFRVRSALYESSQESRDDGQSSNFCQIVVRSVEITIKVPSFVRQ
uniref:Uncharacterized protein n=1 Tax=Megaselia scalaris TaxID=36166 RepID=T1GSJ8_MEGSC